MKLVALSLAIGLVSWGQSMTEAAAAVTGGTIGGAAGKKVSESIDSIFGKVDSQLKGAAKGTAARGKSSAPLIQVGPGTPRPETVPPPPPVQGGRRAPAPHVEMPRALAYLPPPAVQPAPVAPPVTTDALSQLAAGASRADVMKLGTPAFRITMYDDGHLVEVFRYVTKEAPVGTVRVSDGAVSSVSVGR